MITIHKKIKISNENQKVIFDLENQLPEGEYDARLVIGQESDIKCEEEYSLENWHKRGLKLEEFHRFDRDELYGNNGR